MLFKRVIDYNKTNNFNESKLKTKTWTSNETTMISTEHQRRIEEEVNNYFRVIEWKRKKQISQIQSTGNFFTRLAKHLNSKKR